MSASTDILIVGSGAAGLTAAIYAARAGKTVTVFESDAFGGQITQSPRVENYPGFVSISGNEFAEKLVEQALALGVEFESTRVTKLTKNDRVFCVETLDGTWQARAVILATGVHHRALGVDRETELIGNGVSYCAVCDGTFFKGKNVVVVGGGDTAFQEAIYLTDFCAAVTLIHRRKGFRAEQRLVDRFAAKQGTRILTDAVVVRLNGTDALSSVTVRNIVTGAEEVMDAEGLFVAVGQVADNEAFRDTVALDSNGFILTGEDCKTSLEGVFAAGDCRVKTVRQLTTAVGDGAVAAVGACEYLEQND